VYKAIKTTNNTNIGEVIEQVNMWSINNNMLLNQSKPTILNVALSEKKLSDMAVQQVSPSNTAKFLGVTVDSTLSFNKHVDTISAKCNSKLFLMRQLDNEGLLTFYKSNIMPVVASASPVWHCLLSDKE